MADTFNKKEREKKRDKKKQEKAIKKEARKENGGGNWEDMIMYVDANGRLVETPQDNAAEEIAVEDIDINIPKREHMEEEDNALEGVINHFDDGKGFGFIKMSNGESFFFHQNNVSGTPAVGKKVNFEKEKGPKGWSAVKVTFI